MQDSSKNRLVTGLSEASLGSRQQMNLADSAGNFENINGLQKNSYNMSNMLSPCSTVKHALDRCGWRQDLTILSDCTPERAGWLGRRYTTSLTQRITDRSGGKMDWYMKY